jgi:hypothetical protein
LPSTISKMKLTSDSSRNPAAPAGTWSGHKAAGNHVVCVIQLHATLAAKNTRLWADWAAMQTLRAKARQLQVLARL